MIKNFNKVKKLFSDNILLSWYPDCNNSQIIVNNHVIDPNYIYPSENNSDRINYFIKNGIITDSPTIEYESRTGLTGDLKVSIPINTNIKLPINRDTLHNFKISYTKLNINRNCEDVDIVILSDYNKQYDHEIGIIACAFDIEKQFVEIHEENSVTLTFYPIDENCKILFDLDDGNYKFEEEVVIFVPTCINEYRPKLIKLKVNVINPYIGKGHNWLRLAYTFLNKFCDFSWFKLLNRSYYEKGLFERRLIKFNNKLIYHRNYVPIKIYDDINDWIEDNEFPLQLKPNHYLLDPFTKLIKWHEIFTIMTFLKEKEYYRLLKAAGLEDEDKDEFEKEYPINSFEYELIEYYDNLIGKDLENEINEIIKKCKRGTFRKLKDSIRNYLKMKKIEKSIEDFIEENPDIKVTIQDSVDAGNCESGTKAFVEQHIPQEIQEQGYITIKELWNYRKFDKYNIDRIFLHIMNKHGYFNN